MDLYILRLYAISVTFHFCFSQFQGVGKVSKVVARFSNSTDTVFAHNKLVVCYWGTWSAYRKDEGKFDVTNIDPTLCTHLVYSFSGLDPATYTITSLDPWLDLEDNYGLGTIKKVIELKKQYRHLKVSLAIGGWNEGSSTYSNMAAVPSRRRAFVNSVVTFLRKYGFDGFDLDWEYPGQRGGRPEDKQNFVYLVQELKAALRRSGFLLTAAVSASKDVIREAYDVASLAKHVDYLHVMCYDYYGKWDHHTGHNAPLYGHSNISYDDDFKNVDDTIQHYLKLGAPPGKLVLGVPLYGRTFRLLDDSRTGVGVATMSTALQGPYTKSDGFMGYNEICEEQLKASWTQVWDFRQEVPFMYLGKKWVSFDNEQSIRKKTEYAFKKRLAGVMAWSIDTDDFRGNCGRSKSPLLRAINHGFHKAKQQVENSAEKHGGAVVWNILFPILVANLATHSLVL